MSYTTRSMNDDQASDDLEALRAEHRRLDDEIAELIGSGGVDQLTVARLKKRKLQLKDRIQFLIDNSIPDIIA